jgi:hypothetical protein
MKRIFVFGIGGTGSRVIESLVYLLAAGVELRDSTMQSVQVVPMLLDTDATNQDTIDCVKALEFYEKLHRASSGAGFFAANITPLSSLAQEASGDISRSFRLNYEGVENATFHSFIDYDQIGSPATKRLLEGLYSDQNMNDSLKGGFLGNPNIGAVVLSGFKDTEDFKLFATSFNPGDRIFIVGSVFGGTGAAGLPWLQKALRSREQNTGAADAIRQAAVGASVVLPYFKLETDEDSHIDSNAFITKTKAALAYYHQHIVNLNAVYYLADTAKKSYPNYESGEKQNNAAHLVELAAALAIRDFLQIPDEDISSRRTLYHEFAIAKDDEVLTFSTLGNQIAEIFSRELTKLAMLTLLDRDHFSSSTHQPWAVRNGFRKTFFESPDYRQVLSAFLQKYFSQWMKELGQNRRGFAPLAGFADKGDPGAVSLSAGNMTLLRPDVPVARGWLGPGLTGERLDMAANIMGRLQRGHEGSLQRFLAVWSQATDKVYQECYGD